MTLTLLITAKGKEEKKCRNEKSGTANTMLVRKSGQTADNGVVRYALQDHPWSCFYAFATVFFTTRKNDLSQPPPHIGSVNTGDGGFIPLQVRTVKGSYREVSYQDVSSH